MSCLLLPDEEESSGKISIDELYEKKKNRDIKQLTIFNKILNRIHTRIKTTARLKHNDKHIWFSVPEFLFGEPCYQNADCVAYLVSQLKNNGFSIRYVHPNTLFVSWEHYVPAYVRAQVKKKTGVVINEKGQVLARPGGGGGGDPDTDPDAQTAAAGIAGDINAGILNPRGGVTSSSSANAGSRSKTNVDSYRPTGNLIYREDFFDKIEKKVAFSL